MFLVSENLGDLILTKGFRALVRECGFEPVFCRKSDPESKGKIENVVKYVKYNFLRGRVFADIDALNRDALAWLERTGNGCLHHGTHKVPAEEFAIEKEYLREYKGVPTVPAGHPAPHHVRKDNVINFRGNYYAVPTGTYQGRGTVVYLEEKDDTLYIYSTETGKTLATHRIQVAKKENLGVFPMDNVNEGYFRVVNPKSGKSYSVVSRGNFSSWNYCSCPDFRTNRLGTCKHIEAVALAANGRYARKKYYLPVRSTVYLDYKGERTIRLRAGGVNESKIREIASRYFDSQMRLRTDKYEDFEKFLDEAMSVDPAIKCMDDAMSFILEKRERIRRNLIADSNSNLCDGLLKVNLYPYQKQGVEFAFRSGRTLIADDMGLGKTIQAIGTAVLLKKYGFVDDVWILCPTSLKYQWKSEIEKFCDESAEVIEGNLIKRNQDLCAESSFFKIGIFS